MDSISLTATDTLAALALDLMRLADQAPNGLVFIDATGDRLDHLATALAGLAPDLAVAVFPAWDSMPYDRTPPSAGIVGRRVATLARLAEAPRSAALLLTSARAVLCRVPPATHWAGSAIRFSTGDRLDAAALDAGLHGFGYRDDEHVDEPGQFAHRGHVVDLYPGDADAPFRLTIEDERIAAIHRIDPVTQRSADGTEASVILRPRDRPDAGRRARRRDGVRAVLRARRDDHRPSGGRHAVDGVARAGGRDPCDDGARPAGVGPRMTARPTFRRPLSC